MMSPSKPAVAALLATVLWMATASAQGPTSRTRFRQLISDLSSPGIDRGLYQDDSPREAGGGPTGGRDRGTPFLPGSVIVKFRPGTAVTAQRAMLNRVSGTAGAALTDADFEIVNIDPAANPEAVASLLDLQPDVEYAQARYRVRPMFTPDDPLYAQQWNFPAIDMERAWDINPGAASTVTVAVLDGGVAFRSGIFRFFAAAAQLEDDGPIFPALGTVDVPFAAAPDLGGPERFLAPRDFIWNDTNPLDFSGHGTHVAGTIGQLTNNGIGGAGMAFNVRIMPVKVVDTEWDFIFGSPFEGTDDVVARGLRYAADNGAQVINMSIGRTGPAAPVVQDAVAYAVSRGAFVVVAAGNAFLGGNPTQRLAEFAPQIDGMVAVGAVGRDKARARYSNTGPYVELVAPGGDSTRGGPTAQVLQQTFDFGFTDTYLDGPQRYVSPRFDVFAYQFLQGTSMAAPHVSGFAALLVQQGIRRPAAIEAIMKRYAADLGSAGRDNEYGEGLINPRAALRGLGLLR